MTEEVQGEVQEVELPQEEEAATPPDPIEALAMEKGWSRKEDWRGPEDAWRPARDFISYGIDRGKTASREIRDMRETVSRTERAVSTMAEREIAKAREAAEARYQAAVETGDPAAITQATRAYDAAVAAAANPVAGPDPSVTEFTARNGWFGKDDAATSYAQSVAQRFADQGFPPARQVEEAERAVKNRFPDLFEAPRAPVKPQASVAAPNTRTGTTSRQAKGFNDLPREAQEAGKRMASKLGFTLEDYATTWYKDNAA